MRRVRDLLVVVPVVVAVLGSSLPALAAAPAVAAPAVAAQAVPEEFTPYSRVSDGAEGGRVAQIFQVPAFTRFGDGRWRQVDNRIERGSDPSSEQAAFEVRGGYRPLQFGRTAARLAGIDLDRGQVRLSAQGLAGSVGELTPDGVLYRGVAPDTDLTIRPSGAGFRSVFRLNSAVSPTSFRFHLSDPTGQLGAPAPDADGGVVFANQVDPDVRFGFRRAYAYELDLEQPQYAIGHDLDSAQLTITKAGDGYDTGGSAVDIRLPDGTRYRIHTR